MKAFKIYLSCAALFLFCSCWKASEVTISVNEAGDTFNTDSQPVNQKMDILLVMDCSGSMSQEIGSVQQNVLSFVEKYMSTGYDFRIGVIRTGAWAQYLYNAEQARLEDPTNLALHVDGTNGIQNDMLPGLNILHSGQSINDFEDESDFTSLTGSPILDLGSITETDRQALKINFCGCTHRDFNLDGDFKDIIASGETITEGCLRESYKGHQRDFNNDGDTYDRGLTVSEVDLGIDVNCDGDMTDVMSGISEFVEGWSIDVNNDGDAEDSFFVYDKVLNNSPIESIRQEGAISEVKCETPHEKVKVSLDLNQDGDFDEGLSPDIILNWNENNPLNETNYGVDLNGDGDIEDTVTQVDLNNNGRIDTNLRISEEEVYLQSCILFNDPNDPDKDTWVKRNPDTFLAKFSKNVDVYGLTSGGHHGGFLDPVEELDFDTSARPFHVDERSFQAVMAFIEHGDFSVQLSQKMYQEYEAKGLSGEEKDYSSTYSIYSDFWSRFKDTRWDQSGPKNFFRKGAFLAVIAVTDEVEASREDLDPQPDNGPVDSIPVRKKEHYPVSCSLEETPCEEPEPRYIEGEEFLNFMREFVIEKEGWCLNQSDENLQRCKQNLVESANNLFSIYIITKTHDLHPRYNVFQEVAEASKGLFLDIDEGFGQDLKRISKDIVEATSVYYLKRLAQRDTVRVSWTWSPKKGDVPLIVPEKAFWGYIYTPSTPGEIVTHLRVDVPELPKNMESNSLIFLKEGFEYDDKGNFVRFHGTQYLPLQNSKLHLDYTPRNLRDAF